MLISDIGLPEMDGYDLIQQVRRELSPGRDIPAIALTAYARSEDRTRALRAGLSGPYRQAGRAQRAAGHDRQLRRAHRRPSTAALTLAVAAGLQACLESALRLHEIVPEVAHRGQPGRHRPQRERARLRLAALHLSQVHGADTGAPGLARTV